MTRPHLASFTRDASAYDFDRHGFAVLNKFLDVAELPEIRELVESSLGSGSEQACKRPYNALFPLRWNDRTVHLLLNSGARIERLRVTSQADDLRWISGYISSKEGHTPPLWWHQDWWCWDHKASFQRNPVQIATLCYLSETRIENGALRVLPGSHHRSAPIHALLPDAHCNAAAGLDPEDAAMSNLPGQLTLAMNPGDAVVIDYRLLHGTHANTSAVRRDCVILNFVPRWCQLAEDIKAHLMSHPAQPSAGEIAPSSLRNLLPTFTGERRDLPLNRNAPAKFSVIDQI